MNYKKVYCDAFGYAMHNDTFIKSELSGNMAVDIHHIVTREHRIENLMALTRKEHILFGEIKSHTVFLLERHRAILTEFKIDYDAEWFNEKIKQYE